MAPAGTKPDKRQRSIAQMFGAKDPSFAAANKNGSPSASSATVASARPTAPVPKTKSKASKLNVQTLMTAGRLARIAYQKLPPIDRESYRDSLSAEFKELLALELDPGHGLGPSYLHVLRAQLTQQYFLDLKRFLIAQGLNQPRNDIYPTANNIYHWSRATPLDKIRVVIIGQDPYHGPGQAHGLSFSVPKGIPIPGSLRNVSASCFSESSCARNISAYSGWPMHLMKIQIYQELKREYPDFKPPGYGTLRSWAESGVLLLNTSLTVKKGSAGSHSNKGWEQFTDAVVDAIDLYGGLGLLNKQGSIEADQALEPVSKRLKVDHTFSSEAGPSEVAAKDSQPASSVSDPKPTLSGSDPNPTLPASVSESKEALLEGKPSTDGPDHPTSIASKQCEESQPTPPDANPAEPNAKTEPSGVAELAVQTPSIMAPEEKKSQDLPGFGKGVVFLCWGKWAADRVARLSEVSISYLNHRFRRNKKCN